MAYVYVVESIEQGAFKVGIADNPQSRLTSLQTGNPAKLRIAHAVRLETRKAAKRAESMVHERLWRWRIQGEWFKAPANDIASVMHLIALSVEMERRQLKDGMETLAKLADASIRQLPP